MKTTVLAFTLISVCVLFMNGCTPAPKTDEGKTVLGSKVEASISLAKKEDPGLKKFFDTAAGLVNVAEVFKICFRELYIIFHKGLSFSRSWPSSSFLIAVATQS